MPGAADTQVKEEPKEMSVEDLERRIAEANDEDLLEEHAGEGGEPAAIDAEAAEIERQAMSKGWVPKDKFKGPEGKWTDAKTFVERGKQFNKNLQTENAQLKAQLAAFQGTAEQFRKFHADTMERRDKELDTALAELKKARRQADREEDDDLVEVIDGRMKLLDDEREKVKKEKEDVAKAVVPVVEAPAQVDPVLQAWIDDGNDWFVSDQKMAGYASNVIAAELRKAGNALSGRPFLDEVRRQMEEDMPHKFKKQEDPEPTPQRRSIVDGGSRNGKTSSGERTIRDLPSEDRELCRQFVKEGFITEKAYLKSYFERNPL